MCILLVDQEVSVLDSLNQAQKLIKEVAKCLKTLNMHDENVLDQRSISNIKTTTALKFKVMGLTIHSGFAAGTAIRFMTIFRVLETTMIKKTSIESMHRRLISQGFGME